MSPGFKLPIKESIKSFFTEKNYFISPADQNSNEDISRIKQICSQELVYNTLFKEKFKGKPYTKKNAIDFLNWAKAGWDKNKWFVFFIRNTKKEIVGAIDIKSDNLESAEIGYWMSSDTKGVMTNAVKMLCGIAKKAGFKSLYGLTVLANTKSQNVLIRSGFINIGKITEDGKEYIKFKIKT